VGVKIGDGAPGPIAIDMVQVHSRKDRIVSGLTKGVEFLFKKEQGRLDQRDRAAHRQRRRRRV
jgi:hypothetical protein